MKFIWKVLALMFLVSTIAYDQKNIVIMKMTVNPAIILISFVM